MRRSSWPGTTARVRPRAGGDLLPAELCSTRAHGMADAAPGPTCHTTSPLPNLAGCWLLAPAPAPAPAPADAGKVLGVPAEVGAAVRKAVEPVVEWLQEADSEEEEEEDDE